MSYARISKFFSYYRPYWRLLLADVLCALVVAVITLLLPLVVLIEIVSYFIRPMSLSIRLFANMMAGHMMLKVMAGFVVMLRVREDGHSIS